MVPGIVLYPQFQRGTRHGLYPQGAYILVLSSTKAFSELIQSNTPISATYSN